MVIYSYSRINTFEQCPLKFKYKYIDKIPPEIEDTIESYLGRTIHISLEWLYKKVMRGNIPSVDDLIKYYLENWQNNFNQNILTVNQNSNPKDYLNKGIQFLISYYAKHHPFDENTLEVEKKILFDLDSGGEYKLQGFIDRLVHNPETNEIEIHDYKTANSLPTQDRIDNDRQLALYALAIKELFGDDKEVCLVWHYLAHNQKICSKRTNNQLQKLKQETLELIKKIESTTHFPAQKGILCNWCGYKNLCSE